MIERDYIMRMIQQLSQALVRILFLKSQKEYPEALSEIRKASRTILGADLDVLQRLSDRQMIDLLLQTRMAHPSPGRLVLEFERGES